MADIRKRINADGSTGYQVRYIDKSKKSGFGYKTFFRAKDANHFKAQMDLRENSLLGSSEINSVEEAVERWLSICEKQGTAKRDEPVTDYTLKQYRHRASIIKSYDWSKPLRALTTPDVVKFKGWLLENCSSRDQARKILSSFHSVILEMALRGVVASNFVAGVSIKAESRYDKELEIPSEREVALLLAASDKLANSKNKQIAKTWQRYRPLLYLAVDTGMRPQEYLALPKANLKKTGYIVNQAIERPGIKISVTKTPAGRRFLPGSADVIDMVRHYADKYAPSSEFDLVFPTASGRWQSIDNWRKRGFYAVCEEAGVMKEIEVNGEKKSVPKFTPYALRHFYASMIINQGLDLKRIQSRMGHTSIETTLNIYGHLIERQHNDDVEEGLLGIMTKAQKSCGVDVAHSV